MPIYDYHCDQCGHTFSQVQSYTDATLEVCPSCGKRPRKLMATPAIVFKGGGWYKTDSRPAQKDGAKDGATDGAKDGAGTAKVDGGTSEKGDTKTEPIAKTDAPTQSAPKGEKPAPAAPKGEATSS